MPKLTALGHVGLAFEATYGTAVPPVAYIPYDSIKVEDDIKKVTDEGRRAVLSKEFAVYNATRSSKVEVDFNAYPDILGYLFKAFFGQDSVSGANPNYTHTFKVLNAADPSLTLSDYNAVTERQYAGSVLDELSLKFDTENVMKASAKFQGKASAIGTTTTPTFTQLTPFMGFQLTASIGGTANLNVVGGEVSFKQENKLLFTANNTQDPSKFAAGRMEASGKLTFDVEDESEYLLYTSGNQPSLSLTFAINANTSLQISFGKIDISKAPIDRSQEFLRVDMDFKALFNSTDNGMATVVLKNNVATY